jgi:Flp pilus assembly protein protease CpaA
MNWDDVSLALLLLGAVGVIALLGHYALYLFHWGLFGGQDVKPLVTGCVCMSRKHDALCRCPCHGEIIS